MNKKRAEKKEKKELFSFEEFFPKAERASHSEVEGAEKKCDIEVVFVALIFLGNCFPEAERASHSEVARAEKKRDREAVFVAPKEKKRKTANEDEYQVSSSYDSPF